MKEFKCPFKRGDKVLVWTYDELKGRIFLAYIEGAEYPYICVSDYSEDEYKNGSPFETCSWKHAKPLPKKHTIKIDDHEIELSHESFEAIKAKFMGGK